MPNLDELYFDALNTGSAGHNDNASQGETAAELFFDGKLLFAWPHDVPYSAALSQNRSGVMNSCLLEAGYAARLANAYSAVTKGIEKKAQNLAKVLSVVSSLSATQRSSSLKLADIKSYHPGVDAKELFLTGSGAPKQKTEEPPDARFRLAIVTSLVELLSTASMSVPCLLLTKEGKDLFGLGMSLGSKQTSFDGEVYVTTNQGCMSVLIANKAGPIPKLILAGSEEQRHRKCVYSDRQMTANIEHLASGSAGELRIQGVDYSAAEAKAHVRAQLDSTKDLAREWASFGVFVENLNILMAGDIRFFETRLKAASALEVMTGGNILITSMRTLKPMEELAVKVLNLVLAKWPSFREQGAGPHVVCLLVFLQAEGRLPARTFRDTCTKEVEEAERTLSQLLGASINPALPSRPSVMLPVPEESQERTTAGDIPKAPSILSDEEIASNIATTQAEGQAATSMSDSLLPSSKKPAGLRA